MSATPTTRHRRYRPPRAGTKRPEEQGYLDHRISDLVKGHTSDASAWAPVEEELARYGVSVLRCWIRDGSLAVRVRKLTGHAMNLDSRVTADQDSLTELIGTTVAVSLCHFRRRALAGTGWNPKGSASARTYFIGRCLLTFPDEQRRFIREQHAPGALWTMSLQHAWDVPGTSPASRPADVALARCAVTDILATCDPRTRNVLISVMYGSPLPRIAAEMGTTTKSVEMLLYRCRARLRTTESKTIPSPPDRTPQHTQRPRPLSAPARAVPPRIRRFSWASQIQPTSQSD